MGEFYLQLVMGYIDEWVAHFPDTLRDANAPIPILPLVEYSDYAKANAIL